MYGPKQMIVRQAYYRWLQEQALKNGTDPGKELDKLFEAAMNPPRGIFVAEPPPVPFGEPDPADEVSAHKRSAAERMAHARSFRKIEQHG